MISLNIIWFISFILFTAAMPATNVACGVDYGTTYSCIGRNDDEKAMDKVTIIPAIAGEQIISSYIHVADDGEITVGKEAKGKQKSEHENVFWDLKRFLGHTYVSPNVIVSLH